MSSIQGNIHNGNEDHELGPELEGRCFPIIFFKTYYIGRVGVEVWLWTGT